MKKVKLAIGLFMLGVTAFPAVEGNFTVSIADKDGVSEGRGTDGWLCKASLHSAHILNYRDHRGQLQKVNKHSETALGYSLLDRQKAKMDFSRSISDDLGATDNRFIMEEVCEKKETTMRSFWDTEYYFVTESQYNEITKKMEKVKVQKSRQVFKTEPVTLTKTEKLHYVCEVSKLPSLKGKSESFKCNPTQINTTNSEWRWNSWGDMFSPGFNWSAIGNSPITKLMGTKFEGNVTLNSTEEKFTRDFCNGDKKNRMIIRLKQGAQGGFAEGPITFHVEIDGNKRFEIISKNGLLDDDVAYCDAKGGKVSVKVTATGKKGFGSTASYLGKDGSESVSFEMGPKSRTHEIKLLRKGKESQPNNIAVTFIDESKELSAAETADHRKAALLNAETHK